MCSREHAQSAAQAARAKKLFRATLKRVSRNVFHWQWLSAFCRWQNINNFQIKCRYAKCLGWIPLLQICRYFPVRRSCLIFVYTFNFKSLQCFFKIKKNICDQVQKLVRPWLDQPDRFHRAWTHMKPLNSIIFHVAIPKETDFTAEYSLRCVYSTVDFRLGDWKQQHRRLRTNYIILQPTKATNLLLK